MSPNLTVLMYYKLNKAIGVEDYMVMEMALGMCFGMLVWMAIGMMIEKK